MSESLFLSPRLLVLLLRTCGVTDPTVRNLLLGEHLSCDAFGRFASRTLTHDPYGDTTLTEHNGDNLPLIQLSTNYVFKVDLRKIHTIPTSEVEERRMPSSFDKRMSETLLLQSEPAGSPKPSQSASQLNPVVASCDVCLVPIPDLLGDWPRLGREESDVTYDSRITDGIVSDVDDSGLVEQIEDVVC